MLQVNTGSIWIGQKVMERISEENQANQRRNFLVKLTLDKVSLVPVVWAIIGPKRFHDLKIYFILARSMVQHGCHTIFNILHSRSHI